MIVRSFGIALTDVMQDTNNESKSDHDAPSVNPITTPRETWTRSL